MSDAIIVGVDGSSASITALRWAAERAQRRSLPLEFVHVVDDEWGTMGELELTELHPEAAAVMDAAAEVAREVAPDAVIAGRIRVGDPMTELAELSRFAGLIVVGTHKTGHFHGRAYGSRSLQLAAMSRCPVAVIPGFSTALRHAIVVGINDSSAASAAIDFGCAESITTGDPVVFIHGEDGPDHGRVTPAIGHGPLLNTAAVKRATALGVPGSVRVRNVARPAAEVLLDASIQAELLVIGTSRRRGVEQTALGPVTHDVLMNIAGPTIVVHEAVNTAP